MELGENGKCGRVRQGPSHGHTITCRNREKNVIWFNWAVFFFADWAQQPSAERSELGYRMKYNTAPYTNEHCTIY